MRLPCGKGMYFPCLGASMLGRGLVLALVCISLLCTHGAAVSLRAFYVVACWARLVGGAGVIAATCPWQFAGLSVGWTP
jgi:hypothetical protein